MSDVRVLIPAYNEARTISSVVRSVKVLGFPAYVVDDGSIDNTSGIALAEGAVVIRHEKNLGKGAALREGFKHLLKTGFEAVIIIDGDGQHDVNSIPLFIKKLEGASADIVVGNRMLDTKPMPYVRRKTNQFMSGLISRVCGQSVPDTQCGYRMIRRKVLEEVKLESSRFEIESELLIKAGWKGFKIASVETPTVYRDEKSKINPFIDTLRFAALLIKLYIRR